MRNSPDSAILSSDKLLMEIVVRELREVRGRRGQDQTARCILALRWR